MKQVPLTNGGYALVDDEDYDLVMTRRWGRYKLPRHKTYYVQQTNAKGEDRKKSRYLHRWLLDAQKGTTVDHRDGDGLNNQRTNLRLTTNAQNLQNRQGLNRDNKTGVRGVCWNWRLGKYQANIGVAGKTIYLGCYPTLEEATAVVQAARLEHMTHSDGR